MVEDVLGSGGMATVYRAFDRHLAVHRAVKVLSPELADRAAIRARFIAEARAMARLRHPHVVAIQDVLDADGRIFIVMDLIRGGTAWQRVSRKGTFTEGEAVALLAPIADAVAAAHAAGIVHRDIKPHNILLTESGSGRLTDFGIARFDDTADRRSQTRTGTVMGTWGFMPPEQRNDASKVEPRSDVYALGATLWALVRGHTPTDLFMADREPEMLEGLTSTFAELVQKATRYRPGERFDTAEQFAQALRDIAPELSDEPVPPPVKVPASGTGDTGDTLVALLEARQTPDGHATVADARTHLRPPSFDTVVEQQVVPAPEPDPEAPPLVEDDHYGRRRPAGLAGFAIAAAMVVLAVGAFAMVGSRISAPTEPGTSEPGPAVSIPPEEPGVALAPGPASEPPDRPQPAVAVADSPPAPDSPSPPPVAAAAPAEPAVGTAAPPDPTPPDEPDVGSATPPDEPVEVPVQHGRVVVQGDVRELWLEDADHAQFDPGRVPVGHYRVWALFGTSEQKVVAAEIDVVADRPVHLKCAPSFQKCVPRK